MRDVQCPKSNCVFGTVRPSGQYGIQRICGFCGGSGRVSMRRATQHNTLMTRAAQYEAMQKRNRA